MGESGAIKMFIGKYDYNIDDKGRLFIPNTYKSILGEQLVVVKGMEECIYLYSFNDWEKLVNKINDLSFTKQSNRQFGRLFLSGAYNVNVDAKGRINLDGNLIAHAGLTKECVIIGAGNRIEIWNKEKWDNYYSDSASLLAAISEEVDL